MLISDSHKFIFVHIRKAAGSSIRDTLAPLSLNVPKNLKSKLKSRALKIEKNYNKFSFKEHSPITQAKNIMPSELFDSYFKFAFVRNPFTRLVSEYEFIRRRLDHGRYKKVIKMNFNEYIEYQAKRFDAHQFNMLADKAGNLQMDFIGRFENLYQDWTFVIEKLNITNAELSHRKKAATVKYQDYYDAVNIQLVEEFWKQDLKSFGYQYEDIYK